MPDSLKIYTIGHSTHSLDKFVELLRQNNIDIIADVRSYPYSRFNPNFNKETLIKCLKREGIKYIFLGKELGARPSDPLYYINGIVNYKKLASSSSFIEGIERIIKGAQKCKIALVCAEKDPLSCHRTILISRELEKRGVKIMHIHADGKIETHEEAMNRLIKMAKISELDLFRTKDEIIEQACEWQEKRIAYTDSGKPPKKRELEYT